jgi:integrase
MVYFQSNQQGSLFCQTPAGTGCLTPLEFQALLLELSLREQVMVMLAGTTGLRRSELFALRWSDVNFQTMEVAVTRSCVGAGLGR